ncbi:hypothetical protein U9M48_033721 [Paspalum notatum var. saurae]|uniref:Uncharacterized protein n=1 Tax=Paspalum notatum var. saurae TaxID=547442 RepID=A0AAQ3U8Z9_PASNO
MVPPPPPPFICLETPGAAPTLLAGLPTPSSTARSSAAAVRRPSSASPTHLRQGCSPGRPSVPLPGLSAARRLSAGAALRVVRLPDASRRGERRCGLAGEGAEDKDDERGAKRRGRGEGGGERWKNQGLPNT